LAICIFACAIFIATSLRADTLFISSGGGNPVEYKNIKVLRIIQGQIVYNTASGGETRKPLEQVVRMQIDDEPALNTAEQALFGEQWDQAVDNYSKAAKATNKPWVKDWATIRLLIAGQKSNRFDAAATAYIAMLLRDPDSAAKYKPQMPQAGSSYIDSAINEANAALGTRDINDKQKLALLGFMLDLFKAKKDRTGEDKVAQLIDEILAKDPNNPAAGQAIARRKLTNAQRALEAKDFAKAVAEIESGRANFVEPAQQAEALFCVAEARYGLALAKKDATELKDAALAYMRVVANFKDLPGRPHVAESLLKTAMIEEQLNEPAAANQLYQQVAQQYPDDPAAGVAREKLKPK
jgi:TolA-binding protein